MGVVLWQQIVNGTHLAHQRKKIGVIEKENMQPHFDMVAIWIFPTTNLATNERPSFVEIHGMTGINEINSCSQSGKPSAHNGDPHALPTKILPTL